MKKNHIIHAKELADIEPSQQSKVLQLMEDNTFSWAQEAKKEALEATLKIKTELSKEPGLRNKYFKYLRRLLELKFQSEEESYSKLEKLSPDLAEEISQPLQIESLRVVPFLSCTQISMWKTCKRKFYYRYGLGVKTPKSPALYIGTKVDNALNLFFEGKKNNKPVSVQGVCNSFCQDFEKEIDTIQWGNVDPSEFLVHGPTIIKTYLSKFDEITHPISVQQEVKIQLNNDGLLIGAIDILERDAIIDSKTAKEPWAEGKQDKESQPKAYCLWFLQQFKKMPKEFRYQIVTKEAKPQTQLIVMEVKKYQVEKFYEDVCKIWDEITAALKIGKEAFTPEASKARPSVLCTKEWCEFSHLCEKDGFKIPLRWDKALKRHIYQDKEKRL